VCMTSVYISGNSTMLQSCDWLVYFSTPKAPYRSWTG
jgi:hypothetical protein